MQDRAPPSSGNSRLDTQYGPKPMGLMEDRDTNEADRQWLSVGQVVGGRYEIRQAIGLGGMGLVAAAHDLSTGQLVAIKFLRSSLSGHSDARRRFFREMRTLRKLRNRHSVRVLDVGSLDGTPFMVMEHLSGESCAARLERTGAASVGTAVSWILQACEAIAEAHRHGIVHRDIKPENLYLVRGTDGEESIKVLDFGISKIPLRGEDPPEPVTGTQIVLGSPGYMPPEQITSAKNVDARSDIWAFGVTLFELITGGLPFESDDLMRLMQMILSSPPRLASALRREVDPALDAVIRRCLEKHRFDRYQTVAELMRALAPFASGREALPTMPSIRCPSNPPSTDDVTSLERPTSDRTTDRYQPERTSDRYRCLLQLGEGGSARVMLALMRCPHAISKLAVLKMLRYRDWDPDTVRMFHAEARLLSRMNHPNVIQVSNVISDHGVPTLVMEYLEGKSLSEIVRGVGEELPLELHLFVLCEMLAGLHYAHELTDYDSTNLNLVHRDVSPSNVFVTYNGEVKVLDFGIAKAGGSEDHTRTGVVKGKLHYMAPEQIAGDRSLDRRADIFAAGVMLWQAITGKRLWRGQNDDQVIRQVLAGKLPAPSEFAPGCALELERICTKALAYDRNDRYSTAAEMRSELEEFLHARRAALSARQLSQFMIRRFDADRQRMAHRVQGLLVGIEPPRRAERSSRPPRRSPVPTVISRRPESSWSIPRRLRGLSVPIASAVAIAAVFALVSGLSSGKGAKWVEPARRAAETGVRPTPELPQLPFATGGRHELEAALTPQEPDVMPMPLPAPSNAPASAASAQHARVPAATTKSSKAVGGLTTDRAGVDKADRGANAPTASAPSASCVTPFTVDESGIKRFKAECL